MAYRSARFQKGKLDFSGVGALNSLVLTTSSPSVALTVLNTLDAAIILVLPVVGDNGQGSTEDAFELEAGEDLYLSAEANNRVVDAGPIYVRRVSGAPTSGSIRITSVR